MESVVFWGLVILNQVTMTMDTQDKILVQFGFGLCCDGNV